MRGKITIRSLLAQDNIFLELQFLLTGIMVFFSASGLHFPVSLILMLNTTIYLTIDGRIREFSLLLQYSTMAKIFILLSLINIVSYINIVSLEFPNIFLLNGANHITLLSYSLVWFFNFIFAGVYFIRIKTFNYIILLTSLFFIGAIYSNFRAFLYRSDVGDVIQYHYYYFMMVCIPLLFVKGNILVRYFLLLFVLIAAFYSFKRAGVFTVAIIFVICYVIDFLRSFKSIVIGIVILILCSFYLSRYLYSNEAALRTIERIERIHDDQGSGRVNNINEIWNVVRQDDLDLQLFGHGFMSRAIKKKVMIDVEWMSMLYYYGYIGLFLYFLFYVVFVFRILNVSGLHGKRNDGIRCAYYSCFIIFLVYSFAGEMFSYQYLSSLLFVFLGANEGNIIRKMILVTRYKRR